MGSNWKNTEANKKGDFSQGSVGKAIMKLAIPLMVAQVINVLYSIVDRIYIGHIPEVGGLALTGVGVAFPIVAIITAFTNMCGMGGSPLFSMARGRGEEQEAEYIMGNAFSMLLLFSAALMALGYCLKEPMLYLFGASEETYHYANGYFTIYLSGTFFAMVGTGMNPFIGSQGFGTRGMLRILIGAVANIILDPIFIFMLDMGVEGAALATVISQALSAVWVVVFLTGKKVSIRLRIRAMVLRLEVVQEILRLGFSPFVMSMTNGAVHIMYNSSLQSYGGDVYVTAMTVIMSIRDVIRMAIQGITHGAQPVLAYNYGAKLYDRTLRGIRFMAQLAISYSLVIWLILIFFPEIVIRIFNNDPELLQVGPKAIRLFFSTQIFMALQSTGQNVFMALGMARQATFFSLFRKVILVIPLTLVLPYFFADPTVGVFLAEPVSDVVGGTACFTTMIFMVWRKLKAGK